MMKNDITSAREVFEEQKEEMYEIWGKHSEQEAIDMINRCEERIRTDLSLELQVRAMTFILVLIDECHKYFRKKEEKEEL